MFVSDDTGEMYPVDETGAERLRKYEEKHPGDLVYHVIKSRKEFGVFYTLLYIPWDDEKSWEDDRYCIKRGSVFAYVISEENPDEGKYEAIRISPLNGGIRRGFKKKREKKAKQKKEKNNNGIMVTIQRPAK